MDRRVNGDMQEVRKSSKLEYRNLPRYKMCSMLKQAHYQIIPSRLESAGCSMTFTSS